MGRLGIADPLLHMLDLIFNMAIGNKNILPAIVVVIEEETAEAQRDQRGPANLRLRGFVYEQAVAFVVIERDHLIGEVADDQTGVAAAVVVGGVGAHAGSTPFLSTQNH